jgi:hypothetical protein
VTTISDDQRLPVSCPWCGRTNDRHCNAAGPGPAPKPGDVGICWGCHRAFVFADELQARRPTEDEATEIAANDQIRMARAAMRSAARPDEAISLTRSILGGDS